MGSAEGPQGHGAKVARCHHLLSRVHVARLSASSPTHCAPLDKPLHPLHSRASGPAWGGGLGPAAEGAQVTVLGLGWLQAVAAGVAGGPGHGSA